MTPLRDRPPGHVAALLLLGAVVTIKLPTRRRPGALPLIDISVSAGVNVDEINFVPRHFRLDRPVGGQSAWRGQATGVDSGVYITPPPSDDHDSA